MPPADCPCCRRRRGRSKRLLLMLPSAAACALVPLIAPLLLGQISVAVDASEDGYRSGTTTAVVLSARPLTDGNAECATVCGQFAAEVAGEHVEGRRNSSSGTRRWRGRRDGGSTFSANVFGEDPSKCGVIEIAVTGVEEGSRLKGFDLDIGLRASATQSLAVDNVPRERGGETGHSLRQRRHDGESWRHRRAVSSPPTTDPILPYTLSVDLDQNQSESTGDSVFAVRVHACGLTLRDMTESVADVYLSRNYDRRRQWHYGYQGSTRMGGQRVEDELWHLRGVLASDAGITGWGSHDVVEADASRGEGSGGGRLYSVLLDPSPILQHRVDGQHGTAAVDPNSRVEERWEGWARAEEGGRSDTRRRTQSEECSAPCLKSVEQPCVNDPDCEYGGLGCNAFNDQLCRFCEFDSFSSCNVGPTPAPVPTPAPTSSPEREECSSPCLDSGTCYDDPSCSSGGIGCNATGQFYCRFCGIPGFLDCPPGVGATTAPTPAPIALGFTQSPGTTRAPGTLTPASLPTAAPTQLLTSSPTTTPPITTAPAGSPTASPTLGVTTLGPTVSPTQAPTVIAVTAAPTVDARGFNVTAAPSSAPTQAPATPAPSTGTAGELGPAFVKGSLSATGVPDTLIESRGEEALVQDAVCAVSGCANGSESVIVTTGLGARKLALEWGSDWESQGRWRGRPRERWRSRRRRLADLDEVGFEIPVSTTGDVDTSGNSVTGAQQAATFFNNVASPESRAAAADSLGIGVDDLQFSGLEYYEGEDVGITNAFSDLADDNGDEGEASTWATVIVAVILIVAMMLLACCAFCILKRHAVSKLQRMHDSANSPGRKSRLTRIDEENGLQVRKDQAMASRNAVPSDRGTLIRSSSAEEDPRVLKRMFSEDGGGSAISDRQFTYTNPMLGGRKAREKSGSPAEDSQDLAQYYDTFHDSRSDLSETPHNLTSNPLFSEDSLRGPSPTSAVEAAAARHASGASSWRSYHSLTSMSSGADTSSSISTADGVGMFSIPGIAVAGGGSATGAGAGVGAAAAATAATAAASGAAYKFNMSSTHSSSRGAMPPYGLSPVSETAGGKGEAELTSGSSAKSSAVPSSARGRLGSGGAGGAGAFERQSSRGTLDDDSESMFRNVSPGSVTRPLQPLLATPSPISCGSASAKTSRSNSFASPNANKAAVAAAAGHTITTWVPGIGGIQRGLSSESLKSIKASGGGIAERQVVREAVRKQRRKIARSLSQDAARSVLSPMPEDPAAEEGGVVGGNGSDFASSKSGSSRGDNIPRSRSMSPSFAQQAFGDLSPRMDAITSGSSVSTNVDRHSSTESGHHAADAEDGLRGRSVPMSPSATTLNSDGSGASADAAGGSRNVSGSGGSNPRSRARAKAASVAPSPTRTKVPAEPPSFVDDGRGDGGDEGDDEKDRRPVRARSARSRSSASAAAAAEKYEIAVPEVKLPVSPRRVSTAAAASASALSASSKSRPSTARSPRTASGRESGGGGGQGGAAAAGGTTDGGRGRKPAGKSLRFTSRGRALGRQAAAAAAAAAAKSESSSVDGSDMSISSSPPPPTYDTTLVIGDHSRLVSQTAGEGRVTSFPGGGIPEESRRKALAAGQVAAADMPGDEARLGQRGFTPALGNGGKRPTSVLKSGKGSSGFRGSARPLSVSFADGNSSSEFDYRDDGSEGSAIDGASSTLRQHLAEPGKPFGSYRHQESDDASGLSEESLSPSYLLASSSRATSFGSRSSYSTTSTFTNASYATSYATSGGGGDGGARSARSSYAFRRPSSESSNGSESDGSDNADAAHANAAAATHARRQASARRNAGRNAPAAAVGTHGTRAAPGATASPAAVPGALTSSGRSGSTAVREPDPTSSHRQLFAQGARRRDRSHSSSSGESKRRMVMR